MLVVCIEAVTSKGSTKPHGRAAALFAGHRDGAAEQFHEVAGNGETEARATEAAADRAVGLRERFEQPLDCFFVDADAGVGDFKSDCNLAVHVFCGGHADDDFTSIGELDRVADEIDQHLAQAHGIAFDTNGCLGRDDEADLEAFAITSGRAQLHRVFDAMPQIEILYIEPELTGLDA